MVRMTPNQTRSNPAAVMIGAVILECLSRLFVHGIGFALEVSLRPLAGGMMAFCCCLLSLSKLFFDISTGSHMNTAHCCRAREAVGDFVKPHRLEGPRLVSVAFAATLCG